MLCRVDRSVDTGFVYSCTNDIALPRIALTYRPDDFAAIELMDKMGYTFRPPAVDALFSCLISGDRIIDILERFRAKNGETLKSKLFTEVSVAPILKVPHLSGGLQYHPHTPRRALPFSVP
jgi:hypothetical protein